MLKKEYKKQIYQEIKSMKKIESNQRNIKFSFCSSPLTIDKSADWGEGNLQKFPNGVFLKHDESTFEITHGVQPNNIGTAPIGWTFDNKGFKKLPIWIGEKLFPGERRMINTLDGEITYLVAEDSYVCYNGIETPDLEDVWIQSVKELEKNYILK